MSIGNKERLTLHGAERPGSGAAALYDNLPAPSAAEDLDASIDEAARALLARQSAEGHWVFDLEADTTIPAEYVLLQRFLSRPLDAARGEKIARYLRSRQLASGGWPLYEEGGPDISATVKTYFALKLLGDGPEEPHMKEAASLVLNMGGASRVNVFTRITLALFGQIPWRTAPAMPVEIMLLPRFSFFHLDRVSYWSRTVMVPLLILYAHRPVCRLGPDQGVRELFREDPEGLRHLDGFVEGHRLKNLFIAVDRVLKKTERLFPGPVRRRAVKKAEQFTIERMKGEGGIGAIFPAMANSVMALKVLGYERGDPEIERGLRAIDELMVEREDESLCQPCHSPVWDTCLSLIALLEAGLPPDHPSARRAVDWLMDKQVLARGDWANRAPGLEPGGWAFQFENEFYPDLDDTAMVLMSLLRAGALEDGAMRERLSMGVNWLIGMQSSDGGWGAFDIDNNQLYLNEIPFADHGALLDPSTSDVTARCVECLGMLGFGPDFEPLRRGVEFLKREQEESGAWFGRWGVNYLYGTWSVLSGLKAAGEDMSQPYVRRAVRWLKDRQNRDGGWGETCDSYEDPGLAGRGATTASQTAWALLGLMAAGEARSTEVGRGVEYLRGTRTGPGGWEERHFTGTGFPRVFYLKYHGYSRYFPIWALAAHRRLTAAGRTLADEVTLAGPADLRLPVLERIKRKASKRKKGRKA